MTILEINGSKFSRESEETSMESGDGSLKVRQREVLLSETCPTRITHNRLPCVLTMYHR